MRNQRRLVSHHDRCSVGVHALLLGNRQHPLHGAGYRVRVGPVEVLLEHGIAGEVAVHLAKRIMGELRQLGMRKHMMHLHAAIDNAHAVAHEVGYIGHTAL